MNLFGISSGPEDDAVLSFASAKLTFSRVKTIFLDLFRKMDYIDPNRPPHSEECLGSKFSIFQKNSRTMQNHLKRALLLAGGFFSSHIKFRAFPATFL